MNSERAPALDDILGQAAPPGDRPRLAAAGAAW